MDWNRSSMVSSSTQCFLSCHPIILCLWSLSCYLMTVRWLLYCYPRSWVPVKKVGEGENSKDLLLGSPAFLSGKVKSFYRWPIGHNWVLWPPNYRRAGSLSIIPFSVLSSRGRKTFEKSFWVNQHAGSVTSFYSEPDTLHTRMCYDALMT